MRILLVDDDRECLEGLRIAIQPAGYECMWTTSPARALELYRESRFDVVVADLRMPGFSGLELLDRLLAYDTSARVIIMTAYCDEATGREVLRHRACAFFAKPINFRDFIMLLRKLEVEKSGSGLYE